MTTTAAVPPTVAAAPEAERASLKSRFATLAEDRFRLVQIVLFTAGAILMPLGIIAIVLGWYGAAHTKYGYDQMPYLLSGGILGLGLTFLGGFLYFGAWLARVANDQREGSRQLAEAMLVLADMVSRQTPAGEAGYDTTDFGATPVLAGAHGTTIHRRDCALIMNRDDLRPVTGHEIGLTTCRVCKPTLA